MTDTQETDLVSVITADHRATEEVFTELEGADQLPDRTRALVDHVITER